MLKEWKGGGEVRDKKEGRAVEGLHVIYVCVSICVSMCVCVSINLWSPRHWEVCTAAMRKGITASSSEQTLSVTDWNAEWLTGWLMGSEFHTVQFSLWKKQQQQPVKIVNYRAVFIGFIGFYSPCTSHNHRPTGLLHLVINLLYCSDLSSSNQSKSALELMRWSSLC